MVKGVEEYGRWNMGSASECLAFPVASSELGSWMLKFPQACIELPAGQAKSVDAAVVLSRLQDLH